MSLPPPLKKEMSGPRENNNNNNTHIIYYMEKGTDMVNFQIVYSVTDVVLVSMQEGEIWEVFQIMGKIFPTLPHERKLSTNIWYKSRIEDF